MNLAEIAVELRLPSAPLAEVAFTAQLETIICQVVCRRLEELAARINLEPATAQRILNQYEERARLLAEAHSFVKACIPHEEAIRRMIETPPPKSNVIPLPLPVAHADAAHPQ